MIFAAPQDPDKPPRPLRDGDVITYQPAERFDRFWCREGTAIGTSRSGRLIFVDTYWNSRYSDAHVLTDDELSTAKIQFNLADYDELDQYKSASRDEWERYAVEDRQLVTSQHRLQSRWFIRKGATESLAQQIANARERVEEAERNVESAEGALRWERGRLADLERAQDELAGVIR